ncbi:MAG: DUF5723 family protein [Cyclobacteriaceae bacterium]
MMRIAYDRSESTFLLVLLLSCLFGLLPQKLFAQQFTNLQIRSSEGIHRRNLQPSAILRKDQKADWMLGAWEAQWRSNLYSYQPPFKAVPQNRNLISENTYYYFQNSVLGPALSLPLSQSQAVAFGVAFHQHINGSASPELASQLGNRFSLHDSEIPFTDQSLSFRNLQWYELSSTYAAELYSNQYGSFRTGISLKLLAASSAIEAELSSADYSITTPGSILLSTYALNMNYHLRSGGNPLWIITPRHVGLGADLGFSWNRLQKRRYTYNLWQLEQVGVSLLNLGSVHMRSDARLISGRSNEYRELDMLASFYSLNNPADLPDSLLSALDPNLEIGSMRMSLPASVRTEAFLRRGDWSFYTSIHLNVAELLTAGATLSTPHQFTFVPAKYVEKWQLSFPVHFIQHIGPELGFAASRGSFSAGLANVSSLLVPSERRRFGVYASVSSPLAIKGRPKSNLIYNHPTAKAGGF